LVHKKEPALPRVFQTKEMANVKAKIEESLVCLRATWKARGAEAP
jgi:hypothetical protein